MASAADYADYRWLVTEPAGRWLAELGSAPGETLRAASRLRREFSATRAHLLLEQISLRRRAKAKFARPERMFFTPLGLEQATDEWVAACKAARFSRCGSTVRDLCCGIGGDLLALARQGPVLGVDRHRLAALLARANCQRDDQHGADVVVGDAAHVPAVMAAWHLDPDRRPSGRRTTHVELHEPGLPTIERLLRACGDGAIKLAPAARWPAAWNAVSELEWISRGGECKQLVAWFGSLAGAAGRRRATVVLGDEIPPRVRTLAGDAGQPAPLAGKIGRYLAEPDSAVLAAGLIGTLAAEHGLGAVAAGAAYLTGDRAFVDPALDWFEIAESLPFDIKRLKALLRQRRIGRLEIKQRGVAADPDKLRQQLDVPGDETATLILARLGKRVTAFLSHRVEGAKGSGVA
ncbi:MAG TPA: class I SAM-dependent methyltransferase [Pirellulales bacterium]|nr:class I SAM-dependent methyltransferase [Pirellulales bacterium]